MHSTLIAMFWLIGIFDFAIVIYAIRTYKSKIYIPVIGLFLSLGIYSFGSGFEVRSVNILSILFWIKFEYLGLPFFAPFWLLVILNYLRINLKKSLIIGLFILPVITLLLVYTNDIHQLYYSKVWLNEQGNFPVLNFNKGIFYYINTIYINLCLIIGNLLLLKNIIFDSKNHKNKSILLFISSLIPWFGFWVYITGNTPHQIDTNPLFLSFASVLVTYTMLKYKFLDIMPIAYKHVFENLKQGILVFGIDQKIIDANPYINKILNIDLNNHIGESIIEYLKDYPDIVDMIVNKISNKTIHITKNQEIKHYQTEYYSLQSKQKMFASYIIMIDITDRQNLLEQIQKIAILDELTQVFNRKQFIYLVNQEIQKSIRHRTPFSLLLCDIDNLKTINNEFGSSSGDIVLTEFVNLCRTYLRGSDIFGRIEGDQFAIFLPLTNPENGYFVANKIREKFQERRIVINKKLVPSSVSFGVTGAFIATAEYDFENLLNKAENLIIQAKKQGGNKTFKEN